MAYAAMASLLNKLSGKLLEEKVNSFDEVKDRVWSLVCMFKSIRPSIMELQRKQSSHIEEFIEIINETDDAIDSYVTPTNIYRQTMVSENISSAGSVTETAENISSSSFKDKDVAVVNPKAELIIKIENIKSRLKKWHKRCLTSMPSTPSSTLLMVPEDKNDDIAVSLLKNEVAMMIERLNNDQDPRRDVIPIVGPGGAGKTTLARAVYDHETTVKNFPCRAWIYAYNYYDQLPLKGLLDDIITQVKGDATSVIPEDKDHHHHRLKVLVHAVGLHHLHPHPHPHPHHPSATAEENQDHHLQEKTNLRDMAFQIYKHLNTSGRYLLVFDDVCKTRFWDDINMMFPDNKRGGGGRIIFTTRYDEVALSARPRTPPFDLLPPTLNTEESWVLFSKRVASSTSPRSDKASTSSSGGPLAVNSQSQSHSNELEMDHHHHRWKKWVDACGGLPHPILALAAEHQQHLKSSALGGKEEDDDYWIQVFTKKGISELIYNDLPFHLKPCLLYLGVLNSCRIARLKELIIAEDLVQPPIRMKMMTTTIPSDQKTVKAAKVDEDYNAEKYLNELISRNLVDVVSKHWDGEIKEIAIPKWLQKFCEDEARKENFLELVDTNSYPGHKANRIAVQWLSGDFIRHILSAISPLKTLHPGGNSSPLKALHPGKSCPLKARSFLILETKSTPSEERRFGKQHWDFLLQNFVFLRVLDLFVVDLNVAIPNEIERLLYLRYLRLNYQESRAGEILIPPSICKLWNLQFLLVKNRSSPCFFSPEIIIPLKNFWRMRQLKHLLCSDLLDLPQPPAEDVEIVLDKLERLKYVSVSCCNVDVLSRIPNLVRLGVGGNIQPTHILRVLPSCLLQLKCLQKLSLQGAASNGIISLPRWLDLFPPNITHLTFKRTRLVGDSMGMLGKLPKLQVLKLAFKAIEGDVLGVIPGTVTDEKGFPQLKCFKLEEIDIKSWNLPVGAMLSLEILVIQKCTLLEGLPSEALQKIPTLRELKVHHYFHPAVETAALAIQKCIGKDRLLLLLEKMPQTVH